MQKMVMVVVIVSLFAGACAPRPKSVAYAGGTLLTVAGAVTIGHAATRDCGEPSLYQLICGGEAAVEGMVGIAVVAVGLTVLIVASLRPPSSQQAAPPSTASTAAPGVEEEPDRIRLPWRAPGGPARARVGLAFD